MSEVPSEGARREGQPTLSEDTREQGALIEGTRRHRVKEAPSKERGGTKETVRERGGSEEAPRRQ